MKVTVCIGSSCHIKGSRQVIVQLQYLIRENNLGDKVELGGVFCMGKCQQGVCVTVDDAFHSVSGNGGRSLKTISKRRYKGLIIQVCVDGSCHLKGSPDIVELLQKAVEEYHLEDKVTLAGSFCIGKCNRVGVTIRVDDDIHVGITKESFKEFLGSTYWINWKGRNGIWLIV